MKNTAIVLALVFLVLGGMLLGQSSNATISGFVQDTSQANVPGVTVTATNTQTGISVSTISNDTGSYTIPSLLPGSYKLTAALTGFRTQTITEVNLGASVTARYNFKLEVGQATSSVEVTAESSNMSRQTCCMAMVSRTL
jgi:hypothetical protein